MHNNLIIKGLSIRYGKKICLENVSLEFWDNCITGILGKNGSGKSSLLRVISTIQTPHSGHLEFNTKCLVKNAHDLRTELGYLPQEVGHPGSFTAIEFLKFCATLKRIPRHCIKNEINKVIELANIGDIRNKKIKTFSLGMQKKLGLAQLLLGNPKLIVLDEPTAGLDPIERDNLINIIGQMALDSIVLFSTHIVEDIQSLCERFVFLNDNHAVLYSIDNDFTDQLSGCVWEQCVDVRDFKSKSSSYTNSYFEWKKGNVIVTKFSKTKPNGYKIKKPTIKDFFYFKTQKVI